MSFFSTPTNFLYLCQQCTTSISQICSWLSTIHITNMEDKNKKQISENSTWHMPLSIITCQWWPDYSLVPRPFTRKIYWNAMDPCHSLVIHQSFPLLHALGRLHTWWPRLFILKQTGICLHLPQWTGSKFGIWQRTPHIAITKSHYK